MGAGGGEHEQRAEGDEEQDQGEQDEIHFFQANMSKELKIMRSKTKESKRRSMGFMTFLRSFHRT